MERSTNLTEMLELIPQPAFCVQDGFIVHVNESASQLQITADTPIASLLLTGSNEYADFSGGILYLTLTAAQVRYGASVRRMTQFDVFLLDQASEQPELHAMALAAQELRSPLATVMTVADRLFPSDAVKNDPTLQKYTAQINRGLYQMLRLVSNMSDASRYSSTSTAQMETRDITSIFDEILSRAEERVSQTNRTLHYKGLQQPLFCLVDQDSLERAVYNLLSNAIKFSDENSVIDARLMRSGGKLYFTVQDQGTGIPAHLRGSVFSRFTRQPGVEDGQYGIGLGLLLVRSAASLHGGTVLMEQPDGCGVRITMTIALRQNKGDILRDSIFKVDYAGERDHGLIELADMLPASAYKNIN